MKKNSLMMLVFGMVLFSLCFTLISATPSFTAITSNSNTLTGSGTGTFSVNISNANGTAGTGLEFNGINYTVTNVSTIYSTTLNFVYDAEGTYSYYWWAFNSTGTFNKTASQTYVVLPKISDSNGNAVYGIMIGTGAGLGIMINYIAQTLPILILILGLVAIIIMIGMAIAWAIRNSVQKIHSR